MDELEQSRIAATEGGGRVSVGVWGGLFPGLLFFLYLALVVLGIMCLVLFIRVANRAVKALDIYIDEKTNRHRY